MTKQRGGVKFLQQIRADREVMERIIGLCRWVIRVTEAGHFAGTAAAEARAILRALVEERKS